MFKYVFCSLIFVSQFAFAQNELSSSMKVDQKKSYPVSLLVLGDSVVLKGAGIKASYKVAEKFSVGLIGKFFQISNDDDLVTSTHDMSLYGLNLDFFPMASTDRRGLYISGAVTNANVKTNVDKSFIHSGGTSTNQKVGGHLMVGYQFVINIKKAANILFQTGAGYGNGGGVEYRYFTGAETKVRDSLLLDLSAGVQF